MVDVETAQGAGSEETSWDASAICPGVTSEDRQGRAKSACCSVGNHSSIAGELPRTNRQHQQPRTAVTSIASKHHIVFLILHSTMPPQPKSLQQHVRLSTHAYVFNVSI